MPHKFADGGGTRRPLGLRPVPFDEAIRAARRRAVLPDTFYSERQRDARSEAFTVSGLSSLQQVEQVRDSLARAVERGESFAAWQRRAVQETELHKLSAWRRETIFRTNVQTAYMAGRADQIVRNVASHPFLLYSAVGDGRTRPAHAAMDGTILPVQHPWWRTHYPPNGFNCRCSAIPITQREAERRGISPSPPIDGRTDPGFDHSALLSRGEGLDRAVAEQVARAEPAAAQALREFVAQPVRQNPATPAEAIALGREALNVLSRQAFREGAPSTGFADFEKRQAVRRALAEAIRREHGEPEAQPLRNVTGARIRELRATMAEATRRFPATWVRATAAAGALDVKGIASARGRAFSWTNSSSLTYSNGVRLSGVTFRDPLRPGDGVIYTRAGDTRVAVHEYAHHLQASLPSLDALFHAYYAQRTAGETLQSLRALTGNRGFRGDELARPDKFVDPYFGKDYARSGAARPLEMIAMALDAILAESRHSESLWTNDREFVEFAVGLLLYWRP